MDSIGEAFLVGHEWDHPTIRPEGKRGTVHAVPFSRLAAWAGAIRAFSMKWIRLTAKSCGTAGRDPIP
jgi:hypothetical protein